jgi:hypothetical protein
MYDVKVQAGDPRFGEMLLEQFGRAVQRTDLSKK